MKNIVLLLLMFLPVSSRCQVFDDTGNNLMWDNSTDINRNFNKHNTDSAKSEHKEIPIGISAWKIDRKFGDIRPSDMDTLHHLFMNTIFNTGLYGQYNTTGNNYTARLNRIVSERPVVGNFLFTDLYSHVMKQPEDLLFTNTFSPLTNISYDNCGNKTNGEDHINARFAVNANKRLGVGFDIDYSYARGYYANQSSSHFGSVFYGSYLGNRYNMHTVFSIYHQKVSENGGIVNDEYITRPESFDDKFSADEIPTVLNQNWNRNDNIHLFFTQRYNVGFYRMEKMTERELQAKRFSKASKEEMAKRKKNEEMPEDERGESEEIPEAVLAGRPDDAVVHDGKAPVEAYEAPADTTAALLADTPEQASAVADSLSETMKRVYVPVTCFIHTLDLNSYDRIYQAYDSPEGYYANRYYDSNGDGAFAGDSIFDQTKHFSLKNTFAISLLEGFNKYAKAGLKVFATHEFRNFELPTVVNSGERLLSGLEKVSEHTVSVGGGISKRQGRTLHYDALFEAWVAGEDAGQIKADLKSDLRIPFWGDTLTVGANFYFYRLAPNYYYRHYHSKHFWWDNDLDSETRTKIEGTLSFKKTNTTLRASLEEIQNYTYLGVDYTTLKDGRSGLEASVAQQGSNISLFTAQLRQDFRLGPLHWDNIVTYQHSSNETVLPVPALNLFTNLYFKFKIVNELSVELGADAYYFTKYYAPDFVPQLNQYAVQRNSDSKVKIGGYPFVDVYANMHLKHTRFFIMYSHANASDGMYFLAPHYPQNAGTLRFGLSWDFFN